jgi:hypothetical protein
LVNNHEGNQVRLAKYESIILLILRLLYIEKRESLSGGEDWVVVTVEEIQQEYNKLSLAQRLGKAMLEDAFRTFKSFNLAVPLERLDNVSARIQVFPSVILAIPDNKINWCCEQTREALAQYEKGFSKDRRDDAE